jgi:hypothetical protein
MNSSDPSRKQSGMGAALGYLFGLMAIASGSVAAIGLASRAIGQQPPGQAGFALGLAITSLIGLAEVYLAPRLAPITAIALGMATACLGLIVLTANGGDALYRIGLPAGLLIWSLCLFGFAVIGLRPDRLGWVHALGVGVATVSVVLPAYLIR